jgi:twinkle protein
VSDHEQDEGSVAVSKGPCSLCGGTKCRTVYTDGHSYCFRCPEEDAFQPAPGGPEGADRLRVVAGVEKDYGDLLDPAKQVDPYAPLKKRNIRSDTMRKMELFHGGFSGGSALIGNLYNQEDELAAQKVRLPTSKDFPTLKGPGYTSLVDLKLFGQHFFGDRYDRQVIVCEGFEDAATVAQETDFKVAVVSVTAGAPNALKNLKANYLWLDRFTEIILWFDNDQQGQDAIKECAPLFKVGKVRVAKAFGFKDEGNKVPCKDASDMLQANRPGDIKAAVYAAASWRPAGIVSAKSNPEDVMAEREEDGAFRYTWPWDELNLVLGPILPGQVTYNVAGTGIGKSTESTMVELHLLEQGAKIGHLSFEDTRRECKLRFLTIKYGRRFDIELAPDEEMKRLHEELFGDGKLDLFDPETAEWSFKAIEGYCYYGVKALGWQVIGVDPLSAIAAMLDSGADERKELDRISLFFARLAKELGVHIAVNHHLTRPEGTPHEEGAPTSLNQVRGSGGIANFATFVLGHERNQQAPGEDALITQLRVLKNRPRSKTGVALTLKYNMATGRLDRTSEPFPEIGSKGNKKGGGSFKPVAGDGDY